MFPLDHTRRTVDIAVRICRGKRCGSVVDVLTHGVFVVEGGGDKAYWTSVDTAWALVLHVRALLAE